MANNKAEQVHCPALHWLIISSSALSGMVVLPRYQHRQIRHVQHAVRNAAEYHACQIIQAA